MSNSENLPIDNPSNGENEDERAKNEDAASPPPEAFDAPPPSPRDNHENESAHAHNGDQALAAADEWHMAAINYLNREISSPRLEASMIGETLRSHLVSCARINLLVDTYADNKPALRELMVEFAENGLLTAKDVRQGLGSATLLSLCDIGHHAPVLAQLNLQIGAGLPVLHKAVQLYEMLPGDSEAKILALMDLQRELGGVLTKSGMGKKLSALKSSTSRAIRKGIETDGKHSDRQPETEPVEADLLLFTPGADRSVVAHFAENRPKTRLNIGPLRRSAIAVVITTARDYAAGFAQLMPKWGLKHIAHFLPTKMPAGPDIVDSEIVVFAMDTPLSAMRIHLEEKNWLQDVQDRDWRTLVDRLIPDAVHKRHMFAADHAEGWDCVIGEENWKAK